MAGQVATRVNSIANADPSQPANPRTSSSFAPCFIRPRPQEAVVGIRSSGRAREEAGDGFYHRTAMTMGRVSLDWTTDVLLGEDAHPSRRVPHRLALLWNAHPPQHKPRP